jgi:hypothetical protein
VREGALNAGTPKPIALRLELKAALQLRQTPIAGSLIFRCYGPVAKGAEAQPEISQVTASIQNSTPQIWIDLATLGPFGLAVLATVAAGFVLQSSLCKSILSPEWRLTDSLLSTLTVGGGLVNGVTALAFFSSTVLVEKDTYVLLGALYAALVGLAPFVHSLTRRPNPKQQAANAGQSPQFIGALWGLLAASLFTIWGNAGQVVLFWSILTEFWIAGKVPDLFYTLICMLGAGTLLALGIFGARAMIRSGEASGVDASGALEVAGAKGPRWTWL